MLKQTKTKRLKLKMIDPRYLSEPQKVFTELLEQGEVLPGKVTIMGKVWLVNSWQACSEVLRNSDDFVRDPTNSGRKTPLFLMHILPRSFKRLANNLLTKDKQEHRRLRLLVDQAFQRQNVTQLENRIADVVDEQMNEVERIANSAGGKKAVVDLLPHLNRQIPLIVICEMLGLPAEDRPKFLKWFAGFSSATNLRSIFKLAPSIKKSSKYLEEQFEIVRKQPREGLMTALVQAEQEGEVLTKDELLSMVLLLLIAGHETTVHLLGNALLTLFQFPETRQLDFSDQVVADAYTNEVLRYQSVLHMSKPRFVAHDLNYRGADMKRGQLVLPVLACSNYDPNQFDEPQQFKADRNPNRHLMFGSGPHVCLGMKLARAEAALYMQKIVERWPDVQADFDPGQPDFGKRLGMRTFTSMKVRGIG